METRQIARWLIYFVLAALVALFLYNQLTVRQPQPETISLQELATEIKEGEVSGITIEGNKVYVERMGGSEALTHKEDGVGLTELLSNLGVGQEMLDALEVEVARPSGLFGWLGILSWVLPLILIS